MENIKSTFGVSSLIFRELTLARALELLKVCGLKWLDLAIVPNFCPHYYLNTTNENDDQVMAELIKSYNFEISSLNINPGYYNFHKYEEVNKTIIRAAQLAKTLGTNIITIPSGTRTSQESWLEEAKKVTKHISEISKQIHDKYQAFISVETPHLGTLTETLDESRQFHDLIDSDIVKCTLDTSHVAAQGKKEIYRYIDLLKMERINHIHLRDALKKNISYTPGKGSFDYKYFFKTIKETNYSGKMIFELEFHGYSISRTLKELDFAIKYCSELYSYGKSKFLSNIKTNKIYSFTEGFLHNPVQEISRHKEIFEFFLKYKSTLYNLLPDRVYEGKWVRKYRFNKKHFVEHKPGSIIIKKNPSKKFKIGVIGLGYAGRIHAAGFERLNNCKIIGGSDIDMIKRERFSKRFNCESFSSVEELVSNKRPDIISICTPEWLHHENAIFCLKNSIDVFCEKIIATRVADAENMVQTAKENNRILAVNYNYRFMPGVKKIKEIINYMALGKLAYFVINVNALSYAHSLDLLTYFGGKIKTLSAYINNDNLVRKSLNIDWSLYDKDIQYIPSVATNVMVEFNNGTVGIVNSSRYFPLGTYILAIEAVFERGIVNLNGINLYNTIGKLTWYNPKYKKISVVNMNYKRGVYSKGFEYSFYSSIESFVRKYSENASPETDGEQGLYNLRLETFINKSSTLNKVINLGKVIV